MVMVSRDKRLEAALQLESGWFVCFGLDNRGGTARLSRPCDGVFLIARSVFHAGATCQIMQHIGLGKKFIFKGGWSLVKRYGRAELFKRFCC